MTLFFITAIYALSLKVQEEPEFFSSMVPDIISSSGIDENRVFSQPINSDALLEQWKPLKGNQLFGAAKYEVKPLMMAMLLIPTKEFMVNYNTKRRRQPDPKQRKPLRAITHETFQTIRLSHTDGHQQFHYPDSKFEPEDVPWGSTRDLEVPLLYTPSGIDPKKESADAAKDKPDPMPSGCKPQYDWQTKSFPNCNEVHLMDVPSKMFQIDHHGKPESKFLAKGGYREVWKVTNSRVKETIALKTLLFERDVNERNTDRHRRDAVAADRLHRSPYSLDIYGYCGNTAIYQFASGGSLENAVADTERFGRWSSWTKMKYAYRVSQSIADVHNVDREGYPSMSHTDISTSQFVSMDGGKTYQLNDFNRARFINRDKEDDTKLCGFEVASNKGKFRSPEEYAYKSETAAIDTYSMGNIFFVILTGTYPFEDFSKKEVPRMVKRGERPEIPQEYAESEDPLVQALIKAMKMCWVPDPRKRSTSREVQQFLKGFAEK